MLSSISENTLYDLPVPRNSKISSYFTILYTTDSKTKYQLVLIWPKKLPWSNHLYQHKENAWWKSSSEWSSQLFRSQCSSHLAESEIAFFYSTNQVSDITNEILVLTWLSKLRLFPEEMSQRSKKLKLILFSIHF